MKSKRLLVSFLVMSLLVMSLILSFGALALAQDQTGDITVQYKEDLVEEALGLKEDVRDLLDELRDGLLGDEIIDADGAGNGNIAEERLFSTKYWIIRARKEIEEVPEDPGDHYAQTVQNKIQSAQHFKQETYDDGLASGGDIYEGLDDIEGSIIELILDMEYHIGEDITSARAKTLKSGILEKIIEFITDKNLLLIEIDKELEMVDEWLIEADAFVKEENWDDAEDAIDDAEDEIKDTIAKLWTFKENLKYILGHIQGFITSVLTSELMPPPEKPPYYPGHLSVEGFSARSSDGGVQFVAQGTGVQAMQVTVYSLAGRLVYDSGFVAGNSLRWNMLNSQGALAANGVYLYVIKVEGYNGEVETSEVKKVVLLQ